MEAIELVALGRRLQKIGEEALRGGPGAGMPAGPALVLRDVFAHPGTSVNDITARTGLPQGYVSECVAKLRDDLMLATATDPSDRRRTLVRFAPQHAQRVLEAGAVPVDDAIGRALDEDDPSAVAEVVRALSDLAGRLGVAAEGPVRRQLRAQQKP
jgi:DNA-binding MarR family transcriptional regulator